MRAGVQAVESIHFLQRSALRRRIGNCQWISTQANKNDELVTRKFYDRFVTRNPRIRDMFRAVDLDQQALMLTTALTSFRLKYERCRPAVTQFLTQLGRKHVDRSVPREL